MVNAGPSREMACVSEMLGICRVGKPAGMPPKALPIVATPGRLSAACNAVAMSIAISGPGTFANSLMRGVASTYHPSGNDRQAIDWLQRSLPYLEDEGVEKNRPAKRSCTTTQSDPKHPPQSEASVFTKYLTRQSETVS